MGSWVDWTVTVAETGEGWRGSSPGEAIAAGRDVPFAFDMGEARIKLEGVEGANIPVLI